MFPLLDAIRPVVEASQTCLKLFSNLYAALDKKAT
jgi:hypothetical protein